MIFRFLRASSPWVFALALLLCILGGGFAGALLLSTIERPRAEVTNADALPDASFLVSGQDPASDLDDALSFLYYKDDDALRISQSIIQSILERAIGAALSVATLRTTFSHAPYLFLLRERDDEGKIAWLFSARLDVPPDLSRNLHDSFLSRFPSAVIRTRVVPSGKKVEDVVFDESVLISLEERSYGYAIRRSTHVESGASFLSAEKDGEIFLSNNRSLLMEILLQGAFPKATMFAANPAAVERFAEIFPDADILRYARGISTKEEALSLSSFVCIP